MQLKTFAILCAAFSLFGCKSGPRVDPCVLDYESGVLWCFPYDGQGDEGGYSVKLPDADNFTCFSPDDTRTLVDWIKRHSKRLEKIQP